MDRKELIKIKEENGKQLVSARELHNKLEVKTAYKDWIKRMLDYGFSGIFRRYRFQPAQI